MTPQPFRRIRLFFLVAGVIASACRPTPAVTTTPSASGDAPPTAGDTFSIRRGVVLVANQQSADVSIIDLPSGTSRRVAVGTGPHETAISPDGRLGVATVYGAQVPGNQLAVIDLVGTAPVRHIDLGQYTRPHDVEFVPGAPTKVVVTSETTRRVLLVDIITGAIEATIETNNPASHMLGITASANRVFTANMVAGTISELDLPARRFVRQVAIAPASEGVAVTPDGREVWVGSNQQGTVTVVDATNGTVMQTLPGFVLPYRLTVSPDGQRVIVCDPEAGRIAVVDRATRTIVGEVTGLESPRGAMVAADNRTAAVTLGTEGAVAIIDLASQRVVLRVGVGASPDGVAIRLADVR